MAGTMDALAARVPASTYRVHAWPVGEVQPPCVVIGYPTSIDFDFTMADGSDMAEFPIWYIVGPVDTKQSRDALSLVIRGATGVKDALDGPLTVGADTYAVRVTDCVPESVTFGTVVYLAAKFMAEVVT